MCPIVRAILRRSFAHLDLSGCGTAFAFSMKVVSEHERTAMRRVLLIDQDRCRGDEVELQCMARGIRVARADTLCEAVRVLGARPVSLIVIDVSLLRLTAAEHAALFHEVAPGVPVVMTTGAETPARVSARFERLGFRVLPRPLPVDRVLGLPSLKPVPGSAR